MLYEYTVALLIFGISLSPAVTGSAKNNILRFNSPIEPTIDPDSICKDFPELQPHQSNICTRYPHATASAMQGISLAIHECKRQFSTSRWNCSNLDATVTNSHPLLARGYKETSFTHAITAAGVLHQVATSCSMGKIRVCSCERNMLNRAPTPEQFQWSGCRDDLGFGSKYSRRFLQTPEKDVRSLMQAHNSKIGRKAVIDQKSTKCKCHGLSSSCEIKTCWLAAPDFRSVGDKLKQLYDDSVKVGKSNSVEGKLVPDQENKKIEYGSRTNRIKPNYNPTSAPLMSRKKIKKKLVYYEKSPTYCEDIKDLGLYGTTGRVCNSTSTGTDSCSALCCGRGYFTVQVRRVEKCNCKFHWCCYVICEKCVVNEWVKVCK